MRKHGLAHTRVLRLGFVFMGLSLIAMIPAGAQSLGETIRYLNDRCVDQRLENPEIYQGYSVGVELNISKSGLSYKRHSDLYDKDRNQRAISTETSRMLLDDVETVRIDNSGRIQLICEDNRECIDTTVRHKVVGKEEQKFKPGRNRIVFVCDYPKRSAKAFEHLLSIVGSDDPFKE